MITLTELIHQLKTTQLTPSTHESRGKKGGGRKEAQKLGGKGLGLDLDNGKALLGVSSRVTAQMILKYFTKARINDLATSSDV